MKQVIQNYKTGKLSVEEVPESILRPNGMLVRSICSLISTGTERSKIELAQKGILGKIKARPDQVQLVINNIRQEGLWATFKKARIKLDTPITLGYSCAGEVIAVGNNVNGLNIGDRVACAGEGYACHSEINFIPKNFCVKIPDNLNFEQASFGAIGAIAFQAVRQTKVSGGSKVVVIGLGLIGLLVIQILKNLGIEVMGIDVDEYKVNIAKELGIDLAITSLNTDIETAALNFSKGKGVDAVIITASSRDDILGLAGKICGQRARVVIVGVIPLTIPRKDYFEKELEVVISSAMGPGSYDKDYIEKSKDYPAGSVPWTAKKNLEDFLDLVAKGRVNVNKIITHRFNIDEAEDAYGIIRSDKEKYIGIIFKYNQESKREPSRILVSQPQNKSIKTKINIGFIGAGSFAQGYLLPILKKIPAINLKGVATATGISSKNIARKFNFDYCTSDYNQIIDDPEINCIFIITRHNLHAHLTIEALKKKKIVFVEKPLAIKEEELREIIRTYNENRGKVMVGFNRRFSPFIKAVKEFYKNRNSPLIINYCINAGYLPFEHWLHNPREGGGRIVGEICHFVDLLQYITDSFPLRVYAESLGNYRADMPEEDNVCINIKFKDGSVGNIVYFAVGDVSYPREKIEVFGENSVVVINNFRQAKFIRKGKTQRTFRFNRDMGHRNELIEFIEAVKNNQPMPIDFGQIVISTLATFAVAEALKKKEQVEINIDGKQQI